MSKSFLNFALLTLFFSLKSFALSGQNQQTIDWSDLELNKKYTLEQKICFNEQTCLNEKNSFVLEDILAGMDILIGFKFHPTECTFPDVTTEEILVEPVNTDHQRDRSVIVQMNPGCDITVFVEPQDYYSTSFLSE